MGAFVIRAAPFSEGLLAADCACVCVCVSLVGGLRASHGWNERLTYPLLSWDDEIFLVSTVQ